jgi:hypothetical protein
MRTNPVPILSATTVVLALLCLRPGAATAATLEDALSLAREAAHVVEGEVVAVESSWNAARTFISSVITVRVDAAHKGRLLPGTLRLRVPGGRVGDVGLTVSHTPLFDRGERVILLLDENPQAWFPFAGDELGKLTVVADAATGERRILELGVDPDRLLTPIRNR